MPLDTHRDILALATVQIRVCDDDQVADRRVIAIGAVYVTTSADDDLEFHIDAIACDPSMPSDQCAARLANWILAGTNEPAQTVAWGLRDPLIIGLSDIASKVEARVARDLSARFKSLSLLNAVDVSQQFAGIGVGRLEDAARRLNIDYVPLQAAALEPAGAAQREHLRDVVASAAIASWRVWHEASGGLPLHAHDAAIRALARWREGNRPQ